MLSLATGESERTQLCGLQDLCVQPHLQDDACVLSLGCCDRVGIKEPQVEVCFQGITVQAQAYLSSRARPSILNSYRNVIEVRPLLCPKHGSTTSASHMPFCIGTALSAILLPGGCFRHAHAHVKACLALSCLAGIAPQTMCSCVCICCLS